MLTDFFHKKYYPDLTREQVDAALNKDENTYNKAVNFVHQNHYKDIDFNEFSNKIKPNVIPFATPYKEDSNIGMNGMMKAKIALESHFGNPSAQRMVSPNPKTGLTPEGIGTHYMMSMDNYAVPLLQDKGGNQLEYNENPLPSAEDMQFRTPEEAQYFSEHYKEVAPMMRNNFK